MTTFLNKQFTAQPDVVTLYARGTGAGANNLTGLSAKGVTSIAHRGATGKYRVTLADKYQSLLHLSGTIIDPTTIDDWDVEVEADLATGNVIDIAVFKGGALADLTTDEKLLLSISLARSAQKP